MITPELDVVMTVFNAAPFLPETLRGLEQQTLRDYRLIIVDDGSTDGSSAILAEAARRDPRITLISQPNAGIVAASNRGLAHCTGRYVARHDADDISDPDRLREQVLFLRTHPDCVAVAAAARHIDEHGREVGTRTRLRDPLLADPHLIPAREPYLLHPFLMMRREALEQVGKYRPLQSSEDSDLFWRLKDVGTLHNMTTILGSYRLHPASISSRSIENGRKMALSSQIAGLSAQRRAQNLPDLFFLDSLVLQVEQARSLEELVDVIRPQLREGEELWLRAAVAMKLVELCFYRSYEPTLEDARFIRAAWRQYRNRLTVSERDVALESLTGTAVRLLQKGRVSEALLIAGPKRSGVVILRLLFRVGLPPALRDRLKRMFGRSVVTA